MKQPLGKIIGSRLCSGKYIPISKGEWLDFSDIHHAQAKEFIKQGKASQRIKPFVFKQDDLLIARRAQSECASWINQFEPEFDSFFFDSEEANNSASNLYDKVFEAEAEIADAVQHLEDILDLKNNPDT